LRDSAARGEKESRRQVVTAKHDILLFAGDNLSDFAGDLEYKSLEERMNAMLKVRNEWGKKFIIFPNAIYGQWEDAMYGYKQLSRAEQNGCQVKMLQEVNK
jgi:5'-nucleotidase (lipoprotein e(P4) family)